jgi:superfamily II DNA or RNA helicase
MAFIKERSEAGAFQRNALNMFQFFQIAVDNPSRLKESEAYERFTPELKKAVDSFKYKKDFNKLELIDNIISEHVDEKGQKGILWYIHPMTAQSLGDYYAKYNPTLITSDLKEDQRFAIIEKFLKDQSSKLLIASIYLLNTSVTLTECKWQVYVENTYDYTMYSQSRGRIFRPGQDKETFTYFVLYNDSIDNVQRKNLESKGELLTSLMNKKFIEQYEWRELFNMKVGGTE